MKKALIFGISGQDGSLLARYLLSKGYQVTGTSRHYPSDRPSNLERLGIRNQVRLVSVDTVNPHAVRRVIEILSPDEIYNLACQSSVGKSFDTPAETFESIAVATLYQLEAVRDLKIPVKLFNAGSGDCFGDHRGKAVTETDRFDPQSPYASAKVTAFRHVDNFRDTCGLFACTGLLFNHESFLRPPGFVTRKIVDTALAIARGRARELVLGDLTICRDWGWAPEYVDAMWRMLQQDVPDDYVIATGTTLSLADFVTTVFEHLGLDRDKYVRSDPRFFRPREIAVMAADPSKAFRILGWNARYTGTDVAKLMLEAGRTRSGPHNGQTGTDP